MYSKTTVTVVTKIHTWCRTPFDEHLPVNMYEVNNHHLTVPSIRPRRLSSPVTGQSRSTNASPSLPLNSREGTESGMHRSRSLNIRSTLTSRSTDKDMSTMEECPCQEDQVSTSSRTSSSAFHTSTMGECRCQMDQASMSSRTSSLTFQRVRRIRPVRHQGRRVRRSTASGGSVLHIIANIESGVPSHSRPRGGP